MQINLSELKVIPCLMMMVVAMQASLNFNAIGMQMASYGMMALMLMGALVAFFLIMRQRTITRTDLVYLVFMVLVATSSLAHGTDIVHWIYMCCSILFVRFFFNFYRNNLSPLIIGLVIALFIGMLLQLHQLITHPELWINPDEKEPTGYIFGGNYNQFGCFTLLATVLCLICVKKSKWFYLLLIPCIALSVALPFIVGSMTSAASITLFLLTCAVPSHRLRQIGIVTLLIAVILFQIFVCFNGKGIENNDLMVWFVEDVLEKDITFTHRTQMWDSSLRLTSESPVWGHGYPDKTWYLVRLSSLAVGSHNMMLAVLLYGGIIALGIYLYLLTKSCLQVARIGDYWADCILSAIAILCMMMLMEVYTISIVFMFFLIAEYYPTLHEQITASNE